MDVLSVDETSMKEHFWHIFHRCCCRWKTVTRLAALSPVYSAAAVQRFHSATLLSSFSAALYDSKWTLGIYRWSVQRIYLLFILMLTKRQVGWWPRQRSQNVRAAEKTAFWSHEISDPQGTGSWGALKVWSSGFCEFLQLHHKYPANTVCPDDDRTARERPEAALCRLRKKERFLVIFFKPALFPSDSSTQTFCSCLIISFCWPQFPWWAEWSCCFSAAALLLRKLSPSILHVWTADRRVFIKGERFSCVWLYRVCDLL